MSEEVYLDDLDKELAEYNKKTTGAKLRPVERDGGYDVSRYEFQMEAVKNGLDLLAIKADSIERDMRAIDDRKAKDVVMIILSGVTFLIGMGVAAGCGYIAVTQGIGGAVGFGMFCIIGAIGAAIFGIRFANYLTAFLIKKKAGPHTYLVESNYIRSYAGEKEYCMDCLSEIGNNSSRLRRYKQKIEKEGHISEEEMENVRRLGNYHPKMCIYKEEKFTFSEWVHYRTTLQKKK